LKREEALKNSTKTPNPFAKSNSGARTATGPSSSNPWKAPRAGSDYCKTANPSIVGYATYSAECISDTPAAKPHLERLSTQRLLEKARERYATARAIRAAERAFLQDIAVLVTLAERLKSNDPSREGIISSLREQLRSRDVDVDEHFRQFDIAHGAVRPHGTARPEHMTSAESRAQTKREEAEAEAEARAKAAAARPKLTEREEEYCRLFADRAVRGDFSSAMAKSPSGTFLPMCRAVVQDAIDAEANVQEAAEQKNSPATSPLEGNATKTAREIREIFTTVPGKN
jgi:hypothetical protein